MTLIDHSHILEILSSLGFSSTDFLVRTKLLKFVSTLDLSLNPKVIYRRQFHFFPRMFNRPLRVNTLPDPKPAPSTTFPVSAVDYARYPNKNLWYSLITFFHSHPSSNPSENSTGSISKSINNQATSPHPPSTTLFQPVLSHLISAVASWLPASVITIPHPQIYLQNCRHVRYSISLLKRPQFIGDEN